MTQPQHLFIPADAGEKVILPGIEITIKVTSASTGNAFAVFEEVTSPGAGPALHVHRHQFEIFQISPDLVVKSQPIDIAEIILSPIRRKNVVQTPC